MIFSIQQIYRRSDTLLCVAFAIALAVLLMWVFYLQQQRVREEALSAQARMVASWLAEPQQWEESEGAGALHVLNANSQLMLACVFDAKGALKFTQHGAATSIVQCGNIAHTRAPDMLIARASVVRKQLPEPIGEVWLAAAMDGACGAFAAGGGDFLAADCATRLVLVSRGALAALSHPPHAADCLDRAACLAL